MPVWHVSLSLWSPDGRVKLRAPGRLERAAVAMLRGVGDDHEWWLWNPRVLVGHLRVPLTRHEYAQVPAGIVTADAGPAGPIRARTP